MKIGPDKLAQIRADTPGVSQWIHFNNAGAALVPRQVIDTIQQYLQQENQMGGYEAAAAHHEAIRGFYLAVAKMLQTDARNIAYTTSATDAYNRALSSIPFEAGDIILTTNNDYASNQIAFLQLAKRFGVQVIRAEDAPEGGVDLSSVEALIKRHRPKLVALTHIPTNSGLIQPAAAVGHLCREYETLYLVDACQSAGQLPLNVRDIHCDFLTATFRKFMRGPRGAGFLYVSDRILESDLEPVFLDLHSATWTKPNQYEPSRDARRFQLFEKSYAILLGSKTAVNYALDIGLEAIAGRVQKLAAYSRAQLAQIPGIRVLDQGEQLGGIVTIHCENHPLAQIKNHLQQHHINIAVSPPGVAVIDFPRKGVESALRISPHYYNTFDEIDFMIEKIKETGKNG